MSEATLVATIPKRPKRVSPTQRSLALLKKRGYRSWIVEKWNSFVKIRQDMFGVVDVLAIAPGITLAVQSTTLTHIGSRLDKIHDADHIDALNDCKAAGWLFVLHGWRKIGNRWHARIIDAYTGELIEDTHKQKGSSPTEAEPEPDAVVNAAIDWPPFARAGQHTSLQR